MGGLADFEESEGKEFIKYKEPTLPTSTVGEWGKRPVISPFEEKELVSPESLLPEVQQKLGVTRPKESFFNTLDFIFENLRRTNYASANTFDRLYDNLNLLKSEEDKGVGLPGIIQNLKRGNWNLAESAWKGFTLEEKKTFSDLTQKVGIPLPKLTGFAADVALDPVTYLPASWFRGAFQAAGAGKLGKIIEKTPIGEALIPGAGLPKEFYESKLFAKYGLKAEERKILDEIYDLRKGLGKDAREHLTKIRSLGYDPIATMKKIDALVDEGKITVKDIDKLQKIGEKFDIIGQRSVDEGTITQAQFDTWKGSYWPGMAKERIKLGSPDVVPDFFEKASKGGWFTKYKHFRDVDDYDDYLKSIGFKEGAERDILKLLAYREVTEARFLAKRKFIDLTLEKFGEKVPAGSVKVPPEGMGLYLPKGAIRIFSKQYLEPNFIKSLDDLAEQLKDLRIKSEKVTTTKTVTESTLAGGPPSTGPRARMEKIVRDALTYRGFTEGEANAYINILSQKGKEGVEELVKTITEKSETIKSMVDSMPIEQSLLDLSSLTEAQTKTIGAITKRVPTYLLPKEIAHDLNKLNKFFIGDESTNWFLRNIIDKPLSVWKSMATAYRLPFHLRNFSSNMFLMFEGDVNAAMIPVRLAEAGSIQSGAVKELMIKGTKVDKDLLNKFGILGGHGWIGEQGATKFVDEIDSILKYGRAKNFNPLNYPKEFGSFIESNSRIGLFIDQLNKGKTVEEAALHVKKYLFNYDELTAFERNVMKRTIPFYCVSDDTECLTLSGWKKYDQVFVGDIILTYNLKTFSFEWQPIRDIFISDYLGYLLEFKNKTIDKLCTPDHKFVTLKGFKEARDIGFNDKFPLNATYEIDGLNIDDNILKLIGWISTDGHSRQKTINSWEYVIYQKKENNLKKIKILLEDNFSEYIHPQTGVSQLYIKNPVKNLIQKYYKNHANLIPLVLQLNKKQLVSLKESMFEAEGNIAYEGQEKEFSFFAQENIFVKNAYQLILLLTGNNSSFSSKGIYIKRKQLAKGFRPEIVWYQGKIWCPRTDNETWIMKRNGKIIPTGNTWWRKNIPLQIEMLATKPGKLATAAKGLDALSGDETIEEKKARPEYFDDIGYRKVPDFLNLKSETGQPIYFYLDMPYNDLLMFNKDITKTIGQLYGGLTPQKMIAEIYLNAKAFPKPTRILRPEAQRVPAPSYIGFLSEQLSKIPMVGKKIIDEMEIEPIIDKNTGLKVLGMNPKWKYAIETAFPVFSEMGKMYPQPIRIEEENAPWRRWSYLLGVKVTPLNIDMQNKMKMIEKRGKGKEFMQKMETIGRSPTEQELNDFMKEINK